MILYWKKMTPADRKRIAELNVDLDSCDQYEAQPELPLLQEFTFRRRAVVLAAIKADAEKEWAALTGATSSWSFAWLGDGAAKVGGAIRSVLKSSHLQGAVLAALLLGGLTYGGCVPRPGPVDPPTPTPTPIVDPPIPSDGLRVLVVYEATADAPLLTKKQSAELYGADLATYLNAKCVKEGNQPAYRFYDKDTPMMNAPKWWQDAMTAAKGKGVPRLIVTNGAKSFDGPLPDGGILEKIKTVAEGK